MMCDCTIEHTARKDNDITDAGSRIHKYASVSTIEDDLILHSVDSTTIRTSQEITSNHIKLSDHSITFSLMSKHPYYNMPPCGAVNFTDIDCELNTYRDRAETAAHNHSCTYLDQEDVELTSEDDSEVIEKKYKAVSSDEEPLSPIPEELVIKYKAPSTNAKLTDAYHNLHVVLYQTPLPFRFTTSSSIAMRNESLDYLVRLLEETEKPILTPDGNKLLSNEKLAAIIRNATKNDYTKLDIIYAIFLHYRGQHGTDCHDYYCKTYGSRHHTRSQYIGLEDTICSVCGDKGHGYLSCC